MADLLVAYEREDGLYTVHETIDGLELRELATRLTVETPFGGPDRHTLWSRMAIEAIRWDDSEHLTYLLEQTERPPTAVRVEPVACGVGFDELRTERIDYRRVAGLVVVATDFAVFAYRAAWLAFDDAHYGALVPTEWAQPETTRERCFDVGVSAVRTAVAAVADDLDDVGVRTAMERGVRALVDDSGAVLVSGRPVEGAP